MGFDQAALDVTFISDRAMAVLNRRWRGKNGSTDVLSFSMREGVDKKIAGSFLGDIVISLDRAYKQAHEHQRALVSEVDHLVVHGLCHLLGYDHQTAVQTRKMQQMEKRIHRWMKS